MTHALFSVEIKKNIKIETAKKKAQKYMKISPKKKYDTDANFYIFKNLPKNRFKSFKKEKAENGVYLVVGELKKKHQSLSGGGLFDVLKNPWGTLKEAFSGVPTKLNNTAQRTLQQYGKEPIKIMTVARTPLNNMLENTINVMSLGAFKKYKNESGFDKLYHVSLIATLQSNERIIIEKNEVVTIENVNQSASLKPSTEYLPLINSSYNNLNLDTFINNGIKFMGDSKFYDYESFSNNCQIFVSSLLQANNMYNESAKNFLMQDTQQISNKLNESGFSYVPKVMHKITSLGSIASRLMGKGNADKAMKEFEKYMDKRNLTTDDLKLINEHFLNFINSEGIKFL
jgi:NACalpha-BTF3-like transcription factor